MPLLVRGEPQALSEGPLGLVGGEGEAREGTRVQGQEDAPVLGWNTANLGGGS